MFDPDALLRKLSADGVDFIVVGGVAVGIHGVIRATDDLDVCPNPAPDNLVRLARVMSELDAKQKETGDFEATELPYDPTRPDDLAQGGNFRLATKLGGLDIMQWISGTPTERAFESLGREAVTFDWHGIPIKVCSLDHLRAMKQAAGRPQDLQDLADLDIANSG